MLHSTLQKAVGKIILLNPAEDTERPAVINKEMRVLTSEEMQIFMREINSERLRAAMFLSLFTGVRMGELLALTWDDVDFKKKTIHISKDYVRVPVYNEDGSKAGTMLIVQETPKSKKSIRTIPVLQDVFALLQLQKHDQEIHKRYNPLNLVFPSKVGTHTDPRTYQKRIIAVSKRCEIQHVNVHALRHTFATRLVELQVPLTIIRNYWDTLPSPPPRNTPTRWTRKRRKLWAVWTSFSPWQKVRHWAARPPKRVKIFFLPVEKDYKKEELQSAGTIIPALCKKEKFPNCP